MAFGPAGEKGGNVRNILTQQSPPPPPSLTGVGGGLIAEKIQMVEACLSLPPPPSILSPPPPPRTVFGEEAGDRSQKRWSPPKDTGEAMKEAKGGGWWVLLTLSLLRISETCKGMFQT